MKNKTQCHVKEVTVRVKKYRRERERRLLAELSGGCLLLTASLAAVFAAETRKIPFGNLPESAFATMLLRDGVGGYALVGVIAFTLGATAVILSFKWRKWRKSCVQRGAT